MLTPQTAYYTKKADKDRFIGVARTDQFFCVVEIEKGVSKEQGTEFIQQLEDEVHHVSLSHLAKFETWLQDVITQANLPAHFSLAAGVVYEDILYLKTVGEGEVYVRRGDQFARLIHGNKSASGHVQENDLVLFTTKHFADNFPEKGELEKLVKNKTPLELVPAIETYETDIDENDCVALFVLYENARHDTAVSPELSSDEEETKKDHDIHSPILVDDPSSLEPPPHSKSSKKEGDTQPEEDSVVEKTFTPPSAVSSFSDALAETDSEGKKEESIEEKTAEQEYTLDNQKEEVPERPVSPVDQSRQASSPFAFTEKDDQELPYEEESDEKQRLWEKLHLKERVAGLRARTRDAFVVGNARNLFKSKKVLIGFAVGVFILLGMSVFFSNQKLQEQQVREKIQDSEELINEKLVQAEEISFLNPERAVILLTEARDELASLQTTLSEDEQRLVASDLDDLTQQIDAFEEEILQKEEKEYTEFYDLTVEEADAQGTELFMFEDRVAITDPGNQSMYVLSLEEKSLEKRRSEGIGEGALPALFEQDIMFYAQGKGVYRFVNEEGEIEQLIDHQDEWGSIQDIAMYFGNIYLLDTETDDIYKYVVVQNGYSGGASYFLTPHSHDFSSAVGMAIDASIYVGLADEILKFTRGEDDEFNTTFPYEDVSLSGIYTDEEAGKVYAWDKSQGSIYVLDKNGRYEREIYTEMLKEADDFAVYQNDMYILSGSKIYVIEDEE
jgi:hypothetical protein